MVGEASGKVGVGFDKVRYPLLKENITGSSPEHSEERGEKVHCSHANADYLEPALPVSQLGEDLAGVVR